MKKIVFITRHNPTDIGGGSYATKSYLEALLALYPNRVTLFVTDSIDENKLIYKPKEIIKVASRTKIHAIIGLFTGQLTRFKEEVDRWLLNNRDNIELVVFDGGIIGGTYVNIFNKLNCKTITIHHNFEVEYHKGDKSIDSLKGNFLFWIKKLEKKAYEKSALNLFLTQPDIQLFFKHYREQNNVEVIGCFEFPKKEKQSITNKRVETVQNSGNAKIVISGSLNTFQTKDGIVHFIETIFPTLIKKYPKVSLTITGRAPDNELQELCEVNNIKLVASPDDIQAVIREHDIYICPTRLGGGLKLRIMDALAVGLPCVIHEKSYRGYEMMRSSKLVFEYNDKESFFNRFDILYKDWKDKTYSKSSIIQKYEEVFSFDSGVKRLKKFISQIK